jgi:hypothetical protein
MTTPAGIWRSTSSEAALSMSCRSNILQHLLPAIDSCPDGHKGRLGSLHKPAPRRRLLLPLGLSWQSVASPGKAQLVPSPVLANTSPSAIPLRSRYLLNKVIASSLSRHEASSPRARRANLLEVSMGALIHRVPRRGILGSLHSASCIENGASKPQGSILSECTPSDRFLHVAVLHRYARS